MSSAAFSSTYVSSFARRSSAVAPDISIKSKKNSIQDVRLFDENEIISLNVGGQLFKCRTKTLAIIFPDARLAQLAKSSHEKRLMLCDAYFEVFNFLKNKIYIKIFLANII